MKRTQDRLLKIAAAQENLHVIVVARSKAHEERAPPPPMFSRQMSLRDRLLTRRLLVRDGIQWHMGYNYKATEARRSSRANLGYAHKWIK